MLGALCFSAEEPTWQLILGPLLMLAMIFMLMVGDHKWLWEWYCDHLLHYMHCQIVPAGPLSQTCTHDGRSLRSTDHFYYV